MLNNVSGFYGRYFALQKFYIILPLSLSLFFNLYQIYKQAIGPEGNKLLKEHDVSGFRGRKK